MAERVPARLSPAEGRRFALTVGAAFLALAAFLAWRSHPLGWSLAAVAGGLLLVCGVVIPGRLGPVYAGWMGLALLISKVTTPILMAVIYFVVITPFGLVRRSIRNPLAREKGTGTLWISRDESARKSDLRRQF